MASSSDEPLQCFVWNVECPHCHTKSTITIWSRENYHEKDRKFDGHCKKCIKDVKFKLLGFREKVPPGECESKDPIDIQEDQEKAPAKSKRTKKSKKTKPKKSLDSFL